MAVIASVFAFTACEEDIDLGFAKLSLDPLELNFGPEENSASISIIATRDWKVTTELPDWISLSATSGQADIKPQTITVTVLENKGNDRETTIHLLANTEKGDLVVKQKGALGEVKKGSGTKEDPYTVAGVRAYVEELGADVQSPKSVYVKGIISDVATTYEASGSYGNASFYMVDAAGDADTFYAFQTYYLGNRKWKSGDTDVKSGDEVIIFGPVVNYKGNTPETAGKGASFVYSLNGKSEGGDEGQQTGTYGEQAGSGTKDDPYNVSKAHAVTAALAADGKIENVYVKGVISKIDDISTQYGNATFYIVDKGFDGDYEIYRAYSLGGAKFTSEDEIKIGDEVIMYGTLTNFKGNTLEMTQGGQIYSLNGKTAGGDDTGEETFAEPAGQGTEADPFNVSRAIEKAKSIGETASEQVYYVKGKVKAVKEQYSAQYGNGTFELVDDGFTAVFTAYRILYLGNQKWQEGDATVAEGDVIVAAGKFVNYKGNTPEITSNSGWLVSLNGQTTIAQGPVFGVEKTAINVSANATSATIKVTGNVDWVAESRECELMGSTGTGAGEVTATFAINNTDAPIVYNVVIKTEADVQVKAITVTITQAKASSGSGDHFEVQWLKDELAAAPAGGAVNKMDDVISFTNSSSYSGSVTELRIYKGQTLTITAADGYTIEDVEIGCTASGTAQYGPGCFTVTPDGYTYSDKSGRWAGEAQQVVFKAEAAQVRIIDLKVHYKN